MQSYKHGMANQGPDPELYYVKQNRIGTSTHLPCFLQQSACSSHLLALQQDFLWPP